MLGLKRGKVMLCDHEKEWEENAQQTIFRLRDIFNNSAVDIQHVGSTSILSIKAKPIIDIAVGVKSFDDVLPLIDKLERVGFYYRPHKGPHEQMLFASGSHYDGTGDLQTHFIHIVIYGGEEWENYNLFRDYLNEHIDVAKEYEELKLSLANSLPKSDSRTAYTDGKHDLITRILERAKPIETFIKENLTLEAKSIALELATFMRDNNFVLEKDNGYWKDKIYYTVKHENQCVCFIAIKDPDEKENLWTVWSDDIDTAIMDNFAVTEELKEIAWQHVDHCGNCGSCGGGRNKMIFGREFDDVCGCTFRFDNPNRSDMIFMKKLFMAIKEKQ